jgi:hypothetical protein
MTVKKREGAVHGRKMTFRSNFIDSISFFQTYCGKVDKYGSTGPRFLTKRLPRCQQKSAQEFIRLILVSQCHTALFSYKLLRVAQSSSGHWESR